ncbi:hypothetical protein QQX13_07340 [Demequina sp. SYSU T00068]|uniref:hypothetical protein n=1 Tax=Demequina lignilytica TaxID=3051663 RepID=UPI00261E0EE6|nr:hypothetical protein [Demequina sp. SYSU T00068]MDN4490643.1 hypothetical protein [Demequina sp. SYSU T00068]
MIPDDALVTAAWDDVLERDGQVLVLAGNDVTLLSPLASAAALACRQGISVARLTAVLEERFGVPDGGDSSSAVREVVAALQERGIVSISE